MLSRMMRRLALDFQAATYRRFFKEISGRAEENRWREVRCGSTLFIRMATFRQIHESQVALKRVHYYGVESSGEIQRLLQQENVSPSIERIFVARIRRENLYRFGVEILDRATVLFILDYVPQTLEERLHIFNLFHKSLLLRRTGSFLLYYSRVIDVLTTDGPLPDVPPDPSDSLGANSFFYQLGVLRDRVLSKLDLHYNVSIRTSFKKSPRGQAKDIKDCRNVLITGWYGTETAGDKAILQELVDVLRERLPGIKISITSVVPDLSRLTNLELALEAKIFELRNLDYHQLRSVDLVVFGGGPLMDSSQLKYIEGLFAWAYRHGLATLIFGCGIGPLKTQLGVKGAKSILRNTRYAFFRDEGSAELAEELGFRGPKLYACDPALRYVVRWRRRTQTAKVGPQERLIALLRAQTREYSNNADSEATKLAKDLSDFFAKYLRESDIREIILLPMHFFWLGNDDREYIRTIREMMPGESHISAIREPLLLEDLLERISNADWGLPMRFHGHIFMLALGIPFVSINYTGTEGKISSLIRRYELEECSVNLANGVSYEDFQARWKSVVARVSLIRERMQMHVNEDLERLEETYDRLFKTLPRP
jgi:polysaccharide pyruvyl transferase WcaK-like protein